MSMVYEDQLGSINAGNEVRFYNPPRPGERIRITGRIVDKYVRHDRPYIVTEATATGEDGRLLERIRTIELKKPAVVGEKWAKKE